MTTVGTMVPGTEGGLLVVMRFRDSSESGELLDRLRDALKTLGEQEGLRLAHIARSTDDAGLLIVTLEWESVGAYRRALSNFEVKVSVVPLLSSAVDEPTAFEILHTRDESGGHDAVGALARDAGSVRLGEAAAGFVPPAP